MKNFVKLMFLIFCFFMTLCCTNVQSAEFIETYLTEVPSSVELSDKLYHSETSIVASNAHSCEISSLNDKKDIFAGGSLDKTFVQNKLLHQILNSKYNYVYGSISHNISSYLQNEICARAP